MSRTVIAAFLALTACTGSQDEEQRSLAPYPNPFGPAAPQWAPQPHREKPLEITLGPDGERAFVSLQGIPDAPGHHVAVVDVGSGRLIARIEVGAGPTGLALHPNGRLLLVLNRLSNFASVIDTKTLRVRATLPVDYYATEAVFTPDGRAVWITNRWTDSVAVWDVHADSDLRVLRRTEPGIPVGANPRDIAISPDGRTVAVAALTGLSVSLIDVRTRSVRRHLDVGAPPNGLAFAGDYLVVTTLSASTHHPPLAGPDSDGDGVPGDGTPNVNFQDLQNEIAVYRAANGELVHRYTSDTICCKDYRDVRPDDLARHGELLPPAETWIVGGALPEQIAVSGTTLFVTYSASNEIQRFEIDPSTGALTPGPVWTTAGHNPHGIAVAGSRLVVAHRLSETVGTYDAETGDLVAEVVVGDTSGGPFPATDAEIGELFNFVTAPFTVDGDQSCAHCHREDGNIDKALSMPLTRYRGLGMRMTMAYRGAADTRPWFFESAMDQSNFKPVINELARIENFCCTDYTLWPTGAPADCRTNLPPECAAANPASADGFEAARGGEVAPFENPRPTPFPSRDELFEAAAARIIGRTASYGDGLFFEDPLTGERRPIRLDFEGITKALGLFLLANTRLLPNPNEITASVRRGRALFESPATGCAACHPGPAFAVSSDVNPTGAPMRMGPVVSPRRAADGTNLDLFAGGFVDTFPQSEMESCEAVCGADACAADPSVCDRWRNVSFGVPSLRGIWDRAPSMLHDGRARGLREVVCTPGHPALGPGETGHNERDGVPDSHGGTSHLSPAEIDDLVNYLLTL